MNIEQIDRRVEGLKVRIDELGDPGDEGVPNKRKELQARKNTLQSELIHLWNRRTRLQNIERKRTRWVTMRKQLLAGVEVLNTRLAAAQADLAAAQRKSPDPREHRASENRLAELQALIDAARGGWFVPGMTSNTLPMQLLAVLPSDFDTANARPLCALDRILVELDDRRAKILAGLPAA